jgi:hypothetical protein
VETDYSGLIVWLLEVAILIAAVWVLVYHASRSAARTVVTEISNLQVSLVEDGRTLRVRNTGAVAVARIEVERLPPHATAADTLATVAVLAAGAELDVRLHANQGDLPDEALLRWRVGSAAGPASSAVRPLEREA